MALISYFRLLRAGFILAREGAFSLISTDELPPSARFALSIIRLIERRSVKKTGRVERLTKALNKLGPTYVKFGQLLATRPDIVGKEIADDLSALQDRMEPFDKKLVPKILAQGLLGKEKNIYDISAPIAAASIAQVHKAKLKNKDGSEEIIAIKILRPKIREQFAKDIKSYYAGARLIERLIKPMRRLNPVSVVEILDKSAKLELDLRFEAAAISEFGENIDKDEGFSLPIVKWDYIAQDILITSWIDAIPVRDNEAIDKAGIDRKKLATHLMQSFLRHAIRDGFFHADMHPGNLFANPENHGIIAVDFGIMGRIGKKERRFLAHIIYGFITRDYKKIAQMHIDIGYVPKDQSVDDFALALRSIGEPLQGQLSRDISMAKLLGQLLAITEIFNMRTRPELILLQKTMVLVEGVARALDPNLNFWVVSKPVVEEWIKEQAGIKGRVEEAKEELDNIIDGARQIPKLIERANNLLLEHETLLKKQNNGSNWHKGGAMLVIMLIGLVIIYKLFS